MLEIILNTKSFKSVEHFGIVGHVTTCKFQI